MSFTGSQSGILTSERHTDAQIVDVRPQRILNCLEQGKIAIVAGFQGVSRHKEITTLGRGGSDTSAVALGVALEAAQVEFFKDVPGIFNRDPKKDQQAYQYAHLTYKQALTIVSQGAKILHYRAIELAAKNGLPLHIRSFMSTDADNQGTWIYDCLDSTRGTPCYEQA
jgi:aspartate kinase